MLQLVKYKTARNTELLRAIMVTKINAALLFLVILTLTGCASKPNVFVDSDPSHNFSTYKTFSWTAENPMIVQSDYTVSPFVGQRVMAEIKAVMEQKGYVFTPLRDEADFAIVFTIGARDKMRVRSEPAVIHGMWGWGHQYWGTRLVNVETNVPYVEGALAIDVFDMQKRAPVWHGVGAKKLNTKEKRGSSEGISEAVRTILMVFPKTS
jgi:hypothetical protein